MVFEIRDRWNLKRRSQPARWFRLSQRALLHRNLATLDDVHAGGTHFVDRCGDVARIQFHSPAAVDHEMRGKSQCARIERGELYAIVRRKPQNVDIGDPAVPQELTQTGRLAMTIVEESAVT